MAYAFAKASQQYLYTTSTPVVAKPITVACWLYRNTNPTGEHASMYVGTFSGSNRVQVTEDLPALEYGAVDVGGSGAGSTTKIAITADAYKMIAATFASATARKLFIDASSTATNTTNTGTATDYTRILIGARASSSAVGYYLDGRIAEAAVWNAELTDAEITSLAKGFRPRRVRPQSLVYYSPLVRNLQDVRGGLTITNNNTATVTTHPRVY